MCMYEGDLCAMTESNFMASVLSIYLTGSRVQTQVYKFAGQVLLPTDPTY